MRLGEKSKMKILGFKETATVCAARSTIVRVVDPRHGCAVEHSEEMYASRSRTVRGVAVVYAGNERRDVKSRGG